MSVMLETTVGNIVIDLELDKAPKTSLNFIKLCKIKYYNFCCFHKVIKDFMVQSGDPTATGKGGESVFNFCNKREKYIESEIHPTLKHSKKGTVSMAVVPLDADEDGNIQGVVGSQFFITTKEELDYLDGKYAIFGQVYEGFDVLDRINDVLCDENNRPYIDIRIKHTHILYDPFDDPVGLVIPANSPLPTKEMLATVRIQEGEELESTLPMEERIKQEKEREARSQALTLEMIGDLPFAEVKAPENVLFICKLNPVTDDEDLEMIFSRFGPIRNCEIIRDKLTGQSLNYAFIEYENREDCELAFLKMDNSLIDDRRIHVDFSQSVSKLNKDWTNDNLEKRSKYRDQAIENEYELVFEHNEKEEQVKKLKSSSTSVDKRSYRNRSRSRSSDKRKYRNRSRSILNDRKLSSRSRSNDRKRDHRGNRSSARDRKRR